MDTHKRTVAKTITFRIVATITTMVLVLVFTKNLALMSMIGILDVISKLVIYYAHERVWENFAWGKKHK